MYRSTCNRRLRSEKTGALLYLAFEKMERDGMYGNDCYSNLFFYASREIIFLMFIFISYFLIPCIHECFLDRYAPSIKLLLIIIWNEVGTNKFQFDKRIFIIISIFFDTYFHKEVRKIPSF